MRNLIDIVF